MKLSNVLVATLLTVALLTMGGASAAADIPVQSFYVGVHGGGNITTGKWDLFKIGNGGVSPETGPAFGLRLGYHPLWWLAGEIGVTGLPTTNEVNGESNFAMSYTADALFHLIEGDWVPFVDVGGGLYHMVSDDMGGDADYHIHYGIGLRGMLTDWMALRIDARHMLTDGYGTDANIASNIEATIGLDFYAWVEDHTPPDGDLDGIPDATDACPTVPGVISGNGCPDADGDGVLDKDDRCPKVPGFKSFKGCKDSDNDGVGDFMDKCPNDPGPKDNKGCPKDTDGDGVLDRDDRCPKVKGPKKYKGCPDRDGDGIVDIDDKCPGIKGIKEEKGCLPAEVAAKFSGSFEGIYFKSGSAKIKSKSFEVLDGAAELLKKWPDVRLRVEGHTDDRGKDANNLKLSGGRAESVKAYFVAKGLDASRFVASGFGETKPVGNNKTKDGRQKNRRIELHVIPQN